MMTDVMGVQDGNHRDPDTDAGPGSDLEALVAETDHESAPPPPAPRDDPPGTVAAPLGDATVHILPADEWTADAQEDLTAGRFSGWAMDALAGDDFDEVWQAQNDGRGPKIGHINAMFDAWMKATGQTLGKSREQRRSLNRARRR